VKYQLLAICGSGLAVGGLYAGGALSPGEVYDLPVADARSRLTSMPMPPMLRESTVGSDAAAVTMDAGVESVSWRISSRPDYSAVFTAHLSPEGAGTRVAVTYEVHTSDSSFADPMLSTRFMRGAAESVFREQVDARLEGRPFDLLAAMDAFAREAAADPDQVRELGLTIKDMMTEAANQAHAAANAGSSHPDASATMRAATRPSTDLSAND
jgi:hypothetical protein